MTELLSALKVQERERDENLLLLDEREHDNLRVELLYQKLGERVLVHLVDEKEEKDLVFPVPSHLAMDAFHHPYPYYDGYLAQQAA